MKEQNILIIEDDPDHAELILDIFEAEDTGSAVVLMKDGQEVIDYCQEADACTGRPQSTRLNGANGYIPTQRAGALHSSNGDVSFGQAQVLRSDTNSDSATRPQIGLILLDLNLPKVNGLDVLKFLKKDPRYCSTPIVILSTSADPNTISEAYENGANGYVTKPISYDEFVDKIRMLRKYWFDTNMLPVQM